MPKRVVSSLKLLCNMLQDQTPKLKVTPFVLIEDQLSGAILTPKLLHLTPTWCYFNTLGVKITPIGIKI